MPDHEDYPLNIANRKVDKKETELNSPTLFKGKENSVTIIITALNEEASIGKTYCAAKSALTRLGIDHQIILINDGSQDRTMGIMDLIQAHDSQVQVFHHKTPQGIGFGYKKGIHHARKEYLMYLPGDDNFSEESIIKVLELRGKADIVIPYHTNLKEVRDSVRASISGYYTTLLNWCFGLRVKYFNSIVLHKTSFLQALTIRSDKFTYQSEILIKLIKVYRCNFLHVGILLDERSSGESKAISLFNFIDVVRFFFTLCIEIYSSIFVDRKGLPVVIKVEDN
jgi:glycosyltransferase involved in cell wall biosynthesis